MIVLGASLGGVHAVQTLLSLLPATLPVPLVIVLHRHRDYDSGLVELLQLHSALPVMEIVDKQPIEPATVYVAPADYHVLIDADHFALCVDEPVHHARPSIDVLFESAAAAAPPGLIGVILTGGGEDGAPGLAEIERRGGIAIVQEPRSAQRADMPAAAIAATQRAEIIELGRIASRLIELTGTKTRT